MVGRRGSCGAVQGALEDARFEGHDTDCCGGRGGGDHDPGKGSVGVFEDAEPAGTDHDGEVDLQILPVIVGMADAPAVYEGYDLGTANQPLRLTPIHQEKRPDGSIFLRLIPNGCPPSQPTSQ